MAIIRLKSSQTADGPSYVNPGQEAAATCSVPGPALFLPLTSALKAEHDDIVVTALRETETCNGESRINQVLILSNSCFDICFSTIPGRFLTKSSSQSIYLPLLGTLVVFQQGSKSLNTENGRLAR